MRKFLLVGLSITVFWLASCQTSTPLPETAQPAVAVNVPVSQKIEGTVNYCASCHTDKEQLISTAKPEEVVEAESTGAG